ncbi:precorrin-3B synthase [Shinella sp. G-2]|uniref:precorrin-3B synthase n=1 Tax=Shinella sp. G-2 TaxID=3133141 RepID=UPI003D068A4F
MTAPLARTEPNALRRGSCPSVATPMQTGDGLLVRLRPVAPALSARDLVAIATLAREHGNGLIEITARGNLQLRGLTEASVPRLAAGLEAAGIAPQTGVAIETPPLAGIDPSETANAAPLADALRRAIAEASLVLAPKLAIVVDGGGVLCLADMVADIRLDAAAEGTAWRLSVGGDRATANGIGLFPAGDVIDRTMAVVAALAANGPAARGRDLDARMLAARLDAAVAPERLSASARHPIGSHSIGTETVLGLAPAYGQMHADRLAALAHALEACGATEYRLAPHRTLLARGLEERGLAEAKRVAEREGFWSADDAPGRSISICAGAAGCASAAFDTRAAADALVAHAGVLLDGSVDLHVSGCPKGCAHPAKAAVTLCGTAAGIGLVLDGRAGDPPATLLPADTLKPAIERLGSFLLSGRREKETAQSLLERTAPAALVSAFQGQQ